MGKQEKDYVESIKNNELKNDSDSVSSKLSKDDRECIFVYNESEGVWYADTSIAKYWRRLEKKNWECVKTTYYSDGTVCSKSFRGSKKGITITDPFNKRKLTDEQRQAIRDRFSKKSLEDNSDD